MVAGCTAVALLPLLPGRSAGQEPESRTRVVMLGTGTPRPDPARAGPATAIVVDGKPYLVDAGAGVVARAAAAFDRGERALAVDSLDIAFLTHLHSDHTVGLPDLLLTPWLHGRRGPLRIVGPPGTVDLMRHIRAAWNLDVTVRTRGFEGRDTVGVRTAARDAAPGLVFRDDRVRVTAFRVRHGDLPDAYGYRFETADRTIVISGDASPSPGIVEQCQRCDVLIHEAYSLDYRPARLPNWEEYRARFHTTTAQLAALARQAQPRLLVLYHRGVRRGDGEISDAQYLAEIAHDLDVF
jgi:ribonuclease BN (tRNA processing enzyme)